MSDLRIVMEFNTEDRTWIRLNKVAVPALWQGHGIAPALSDVVRLGGRQFVIEARVWEHDGTQPVMRLFMGGGHAHSDTTFG
jgi:hypothetical protein